MTPMRFAALFCLVVMAPVPAAFAHGDTITTDPERGERVGEVPRAVIIDFTEPPTADSRYEVLDGCADDVLIDVTARGRERLLVTGGGEPGRWRVSYNVISSVDGHQTEDRFSFRVRGNRDCSDPAGDETPVPGGSARPVASGDDQDEPAGFPIVPVLIGGGIVVLAFGVRAFSAR